MSAIAIVITEFAGNIKDLIAHLKRDKEIVITADNQPVAWVTLLVEPSSEYSPDKPKRRRAWTAKGQF